jgi:glycosyltransferase involved in cell wall biosynthesis
MPRGGTPVHDRPVIKVLHFSDGEILGGEEQDLFHILRGDDRVKFFGHRDDIPDLLAVCDIFVLPSLFEGLPVSILEAMAASKPVIATAVERNNEVIIDGESGLLVKAERPEETDPK